MKWNGDQYGTAVIRPTQGDGFAWVSPRRTYCDRGHWDWGFQSLAPLPGQPSYYFMELSTALEEVALWLAQAPASGQLEPGAPVIFPNHAGIKSPDDGDASPVWKSGADGAITCELVNGDERIKMHIRPVQHGFEFSQDGALYIDEADRFPRLYRNAQTAMREAGLFAQWRLAQIPAQVPGSLDPGFSHEVDPQLAQAMQKVSYDPASAPRRPRP